MGTLYKYQQEGVLFVERKNGNALIADDMGLGKTIQAISYLYRNPKASPAIIVCPSSLKENWAAEIKKWTKEDSLVLYSKTPCKIPRGTKFIIINYDILQYWVDELRDVPKKYRYKTLILDEGHYIKNPEAIRSQAVDYLNDKAAHTLILTGTPIENRPIELFNLLRLIRPRLFPNYYQFAHKFCGAKRDTNGWNYNGSSDEKKLNRILTKTLMIRRLKKDVLKDLPPKQYSKVVMSIDNQKEYDYATDNFMDYMSDKIDNDIRNLNRTIEKEIKGFDKELKAGAKISDKDLEHIKQKKLDRISNAPTLVQIEQLKQLAVKGKMKQIIEWIELFLESGEKLIVFGVHKSVVNELHEKFKKISVVISGSTTPKNRHKIVQKFQNDPKCKLFIGNIKAAGVGITLTAASNVAFIEFPWSPSDLEQAADRAHRITQTKQVTIHNLVGKGTIEEKIIDLLQSKQKVIDKVLNGTQIIKTQNLLVQLIKSMKQEEKKKIVKKTTTKRRRTKFNGITRKENQGKSYKSSNRI